MRVLFVIDSMPCHRFLKEAQALNALGIELYMSYRKRGATIAKDADLSIFRAILQLKKREIFIRGKLTRFIRENKIEIIHYHNYPDKLCYKLMHYKPGIPIVYDQHDLMSLQREKFSRKRKHWEQYCLEQAEGLIFVTEYYQRKSFELYHLTAQYVILPNMISRDAVNESTLLPEKLSDKDGKIHLVWVGLITKQTDHHRYMVKTFEILSEKGFVIHVYPTRSKDYPSYEAIKNVHIHKQLSYGEMMKAIVVYDAGLAFFNPWMPDERKSSLVKHAFPNKINDYIFAGVPPVTLNSFEPMADYIRKYNVGYTYEDVESITPASIKEQQENYQSNINLIRARILADIDDQLQKVVDLYGKLKVRTNGKV